MKKLKLALVIALLVTLAIPMVASGQSIVYTAGIQIQNLDLSNQANITVTYYNQDGSTAATVNDTVTAGGSKTYFPLSAVSDGFNGSVVISSDREIGTTLSLAP